MPESKGERKAISKNDYERLYENNKVLLICNQKKLTISELKALLETAL